MVNGTGVAAEVTAVASALLTEASVARLARAALDDPAATVGSWWIDPVDYQFGTPTTLGAVRLRGVSTDGRSWSAFLKVIRSFRLWPQVDLIPPDLREAVLASSMWRYEADVYSSGVRAALPDGMRLPGVFAVTDLDPDRVGMVLEDVAVDASPWDTDRFARAAELLARLAARLTRLDALPAQASRVPGTLTEMYYNSRLVVAELPQLADDRTWKHPLLAPSEPVLRADLNQLATRLPTVLDRLNRLPQLMIHGDASPQNLLVPADRPDTFVAIDWSLGSVAAVGDDLGQLLIGLAHAGLLGVERLAELRDVVLDGYAAGLRAEGVPCAEEDIQYGLDGGLLIRSTFTALPLARLDEPVTDELAELVEDRLKLTRYLVDLGLNL